MPNDAPDAYDYEMLTERRRSGKPARRADRAVVALMAEW